ncbi:MAG: hypothetical protein J6Y00_02735 [Paludibacteraceae bacterium]|nr:hypothetical protein [Paludibacteraceae bacterium]
MKTMKAYKEPVTMVVSLLSDLVMKVSGDASLPQQVATGGEDSGSMMFDAPLGNKRRQL